MKNVVLIYFLVTCFLVLIGCSTYKLRNMECLNIKYSKTEKSRILAQIDSVFQKSTVCCDRLDKILSCKCDEKNILEIKVKTKCSDYRYFYFDRKLNLVNIVRELKEIH